MAKGTDKMRFYAAWPTAWGPVGAAATETGLARFVLPGYQLADLESLLAWEHPDAARDDGPFTEFIELSRAYFNGRKVSFDDVVLDLPSEAGFAGKVYRAARQIEYGTTLSYQQLARQIARPDAARAVATALGKNPLPLVVPCHRVIYADGRVGGFSAPGGVDQKRRMLELEAAAISA